MECEARRLGGTEPHVVARGYSAPLGLRRERGDSPACHHQWLGRVIGKSSAQQHDRTGSHPAVDVAALRAVPALPGDWLISGLIYDVATGLVEIVVPPAPIRT
jgi:carbonic anhydrase